MEFINKFSNKKMVIVFLVAIFFIALDRLLKILASQFSMPLNLVGSILKFHFTPNPYIAFSLPLAGIGLNIIIAIIILILVYYYFLLMKTNRDNEGIVLIFIILGAISNFIDRLWFGYVVDYFDLKYFTVFNLADVMIVTGVVVLLFLKMKASKK